MKRAGTLATLVLSLLPGCTTIHREPPALPSSAEPAFFDPNFHALCNDQERLAALREFYTLSTLGSPSLDDPSQQVVLVELTYPVFRHGNQSMFCHGYLIDDCGLVLTAYHILLGVSSPDFTTFSITDREGHCYRARRTELSIPDRDYTVLAVETGKPRHSHPLPCTERPSLETQTLFFTYFDISPVLSSLKKEMKLTCHTSANIISIDATMGIVLQHRFGTILDATSFLQLRNELERFEQCDAFLLSGTVRQGYSGTPVFTSYHSFLGLIRGYAPYQDDKRFPEGVGFATSATPLFNGIHDYLVEQKMLEPRLETIVSKR